MLGLSETEMGEQGPVMAELQQRGRIRDVALLAWTYPRWRRPFTWLLWHTPVVKWLAGKLFKVNPYKRIVAIVEAKAVLGRITVPLRGTAK